MPLTPWRWQATIAFATVSRGGTVRAGLDITSRARSGERRAAGSAARTLSRASARAPLKIADDAGDVTSAAERGGDDSGVELGRAAAHDGEDPPVHLDEDDEGTAVGEVDDLVCEIRDAVDVIRPGHRRDEHLDPAGRVCLCCVDQRVQQGALVVAERGVQERGDQLLPRAVAQAPGERVRVALCRRRIRQRAGVLVDSEGEGGGFDRRHRQLPLGQHADQRRRQRAFLGDDRSRGIRPLRELAGVVVEDDLLNARIERDLLELTEARGADRLDDDQAPDRGAVEAGGLDDLELVGVQAVEVADVAVEGTGQRNDRVGVEAACGEHRRERVEVGVRVGGDDGLGLHGVSSHRLCLRAAEDRKSQFRRDLGNRDRVDLDQRPGGERPRPRPSHGPAAPRPRAGGRPRSSPGSRRGHGDRPWSW